MNKVKVYSGFAKIICNLIYNYYSFFSFRLIILLIGCWCRVFRVIIQQVFLIFFTWHILTRQQIKIAELYVSLVDWERRTCRISLNFNFFMNPLPQLILQGHVLLWAFMAIWILRFMIITKRARCIIMTFIYFWIAETTVNFVLHFPHFSEHRVYIELLINDDLIRHLCFSRCY